MKLKPKYVEIIIPTIISVYEIKLMLIISFHISE